MMISRSHVFHIPTDSNNIIARFKLKKIVSNDRTTIYENGNLRFSFDDKVVRVLFFDDKQSTLDEVYSYFYGEQYE